MGPPRPQTPRQGTKYPGPILATIGTREKQLASACQGNGFRRAPGHKETEGQTEKQARLFLRSALLFPLCALRTGRAVSPRCPGAVERVNVSYLDCGFFREKYCPLCCFLGLRESRPRPVPPGSLAHSIKRGPANKSFIPRQLEGSKKVTSTRG